MTTDNKTDQSTGQDSPAQGTEQIKAELEALKAEHAKTAKALSEVLEKKNRYKSEAQLAQEKINSIMEEKAKGSSSVEEIKSNYESVIESKNKKLSEYKQREQEFKINSAIRSSAKGAIDPDEVVTLVKARVAIGEDGKPFIRNSDGSALTDEDGRAVSLADYTKSYLDKKPHLLASTGKSGAGSIGSQTKPTTYDPTDPVQYRAHRDEILASRVKQKTFL